MRDRKARGSAIFIRYQNKTLCLLLTAALVAATAMGGAGSAQAASIKTSAKQAIMLDLQSGQTVFEKNADERMAPSSMTKLMTVYLAFRALKEGKLKLTDKFTISKRAGRRRGSSMGLTKGAKVSVEDLLRGAIITSGNDAALAIAEGMAGSEKKFAARMTAMAGELGMKNSRFLTATGFTKDGQYSSARDIALLSKRLIEEFPKYYKYFREQSFTYNKRKQTNRNPLLFVDKLGADGLKTGHTRKGGYGLAASAVQNGRRLILVINGMKSVRSRAYASKAIMQIGFRRYISFKIFDRDVVVETAEVWLGERSSVPLVTGEAISVTLPGTARDKFKVTVVYDGPIPAPIRKGDRIAKLVVSAPKADPVEFPLYAGGAVAEAGFLGRLSTAVQILLGEKFDSEKKN